MSRQQRYSALYDYNARDYNEVSFIKGTCLVGNLCSITFFVLHVHCVFRYKEPKLECRMTQVEILSLLLVEIQNIMGVDLSEQCREASLAS